MVRTSAVVPGAGAPYQRGESIAVIDDDDQIIEYELGPGDEKRLALFIYELEALCDEMRVMASPHAERLERLIERFYLGITRVSP